MFRPTRRTNSCRGGGACANSHRCCFGIERAARAARGDYRFGAKRTSSTRSGFPLTGCRAHRPFDARQRRSRTGCGSSDGCGYVRIRQDAIAWRGLNMKCANIAGAMIMAAGMLSRIDATQAQMQPTKVQQGGGQPYVLIGTEVWDVPDPVSQRGYQVFVSLPASYQKEPNRRYPVLFVTDANYAFPVIREIS